MILIDAAVGSNDLATPLRKLGLPVDVLHLEAADIAFTGRGVGEEEVFVGIELKRLSDGIQSLRTGRLAGKQLPKLRKFFGGFAWLLVEGRWIANERGLVSTYKGPKRGWVPMPGAVRASELEKELLTLEICGGLRRKDTNTRADTLRFISTLYRWWTDKALDEHGSHLAVYEPPTLMPLSPFRQAVCQWPEVGIKTSAAVERKFEGSIRRACAANVGEWAEITTVDRHGKERRFGEKAARKVHTFLGTK